MLARSPDGVSPQRSRGVGRIVVKRGPDGMNRLSDLEQSGCARLRLPRAPQGSRAPVEAIGINTSGGLTGGDRLHWGVTVGDNAAASITSQACERIYRADEGTARIGIDLHVAPGATLLWWPQETIVFSGGAFDRTLSATVAQDATLLVVEAMLFGRTAMGERMERAALRDRWNVRRPDGALVHAERLRITGAHDLEGPAAMDGRTAIASLLLVSPDAEAKLEPARALVSGEGAVTCWDGRLLARIVAEDGYRLRRRLVPLAALLAGQDVPRGWSL